MKGESVGADRYTETEAAGHCTIYCVSDRRKPPSLKFVGACIYGHRKTVSPHFVALFHTIWFGSSSCAILRRRDVCTEPGCCLGSERVRQ